jgi:hypothetical protein
MMADGTNSTPVRWLTFFDAMRVTSLALWVAWKVLAGSLAAWWRGGGIVSSPAMQPPNGSAATGPASLEVTFPKGTITITVTPKVT